MKKIVKKSTMGILNIGMHTICMHIKGIRTTKKQFLSMTAIFGEGNLVLRSSPHPQANGELKNEPTALLAFI